MTRTGLAVRVAAILVGLASALVSHSAAQEAPRSVWVRTPTKEELERHYPPPAVDAGVEGRVLLCCTPPADRGVDCTVGHEDPVGWGFGPAAVQVSRMLQLTRAAAQRVRGGSPPIVRFPVVFRIRRSRLEEWLQPHTSKFAKPAGPVCGAPLIV